MVNCVQELVELWEISEIILAFDITISERSKDWWEILDRAPTDVRLAGEIFKSTVQERGIIYLAEGHVNELI